MSLTPITTGETPPVIPPLPTITPGGVSVGLPTPGGGITDETLYIQGIIIATAQMTAGVALSNNAANLTERYYRDQLDFSANTYGSAKQLEGVKYSADRQLEAEKLRYSQINTSDLAIQQAEASNRIAVAQIQVSGQIQTAQIAAAADNNAAGLRYNADIYGTDRRHEEVLDQNAKDYQARVITAQANKDASVYGSDRDLAGRQYDADKRYAGDVYGADRQFAGTQLHEQAETARLERKLSYADEKFNLVYPFVQSSIDQATAGDASTPGLKGFDELPFISTSGVLTEGQIQKQVNAAIARNDARTQAQVNQVQRELSGRGFSSNSPLLEALKVGMQGENLRANLEAETSIRIEAAKANADAVFAGQQAVANQFNQQQGVLLESEKNQVTRQVGLVGALSSLIGGLT